MTAPPKLKTCPRCSLTQARELFGVKASGGVQAYCRPCQKQVAAERRQKDGISKKAKRQQLIDERRSIGKACLSCAQLLPLSCFSTQPGRIDGRRSRCRLCEGPWRAEMAARRRQAKPDEIRNQARQWRAANAEKLAARIRQIRAGERAGLSDAYVKRLLTEREAVLKPSHVPTDLVEIKRQQLVLVRLARQIRQALFNTRKESEHESIPANA